MYVFKAFSWCYSLKYRFVIFHLEFVYESISMLQYVSHLLVGSCKLPVKLAEIPIPE